MEPLSRQQRITVGIAALAVGITRLFARSRSPWDWDELLFMLGVRSYDVTAHHPHPPGYPLFIALAKTARLVVSSDFAALQAVVITAALLLFPASFFLARELGFDFRTSLLGSLLFSFLPNVWFYGGTAFSDLPGAVAGIVACALMLRGRRDARAFVAGAFVLGLAAGIRPQILPIGLAPALMARVSWKTFIAGVLAGAIAIGGCYAGAGLASQSFDGYAGAMRAQQRWVHDVDSFHNPHRTPLTEFWQKCLLWPAGPHRFLRFIDFFAALSLLDAVWRRRWPPLLTLLTFLPLIAFTWLMMSIDAVPRYSVAYVAMHGLLAADGIAALTRFIPRKQPVAQTAIALVLVILLAVWTWPAISAARRIESPPDAAIRYIRERAAPHRSKVYVHRAFGPQSDYELADLDPIPFERESELPPAGTAFVMTPYIDPARPGRIFTMPRFHLWDIARRRNVEVQVRE